MISSSLPCIFLLLQPTGRAIHCTASLGPAHHCHMQLLNSSMTAKWDQTCNGAAVFDALCNRLTRGVLINGDNRRIYELQLPIGGCSRLQAVKHDLMSLCCNKNGVQAHS